MLTPSDHGRPLETEVFDASEVAAELEGLAEAHAGQPARTAIGGRPPHQGRPGAGTRRGRGPADQGPARPALRRAACASCRMRSSACCTSSPRKHLYPAENPSEAERMAIVATGGYGRGVLAAGSDIDLLFLLPYKQTAWGESVAETILYCLWDMGLKVGHATRSINECIRQAKADMTDAHGVARGALSPRRPQALRRAGHALRQGGRAGHRRGIRRRQARRARGAPPPRRPVALSGRAQRQGRQGRAARPAYALSGSPNTSIACASARSSSSTASTTRASTAGFAAAAISSGRCAATCTSSPGGPRSGCPSTSSARSRCGSATPSIRACATSSAS